MQHLCDANFWVALSRATHEHNRSATNWLDALDDSDTLAFCRSTQQSYLRLLTSHTVTHQPPLSNRVALETYRAIRRDSRVIWIEEPAGLDDLWLKYADLSTISPKIWMDAYLAAFAVLTKSRFVTFDKGFRVYKGLDWIALNPR